MGRLFWFGVAFILGIALEPFWQPDSAEIYFGMISIFILSIFREKSGEIGLIVLLFLLGNLRVGGLELTALPDEGQLAGRVVFSAGKRAIIENSEHRIEGYFYPEAPPRDSLIVVWYKGKPRRSQLKELGSNSAVDFRIRAHKRKIKEWKFIAQSSTLDKPVYLDDFEHGGLIWTFISGQREDISKHTKELMRETGTAHLMAISGLHIGLVSGLVYWLSRFTLIPIFLLGYERTAVKLPLILAVGFAYVYGEQVGWPPSAQRAVIMVALFSLGKFLEIAISLEDCLGVAAIFILLKEPAQLYSLSFQLSFSAVLGIALFVPKFRRLISPKWHPLVQKILLSIAVSTGAILGTLPLVGWVFQELAWVGIFTNVVVMPLMASLAVPLCLLSALLPDSLALLCLCFADAAIDISLFILEILREEPVVLAFTVMEMTTCAFMIVLMSRRLWCGFLLCLLLLYPSDDHQELEIRFLAIGQGDASVIRWPDGRNWLVDGGGFSFELVPYLRRAGVFEIEQIIISHPHPDHFEGLFVVLEKLTVQSIIVSRYPEKNEKRYAELLKLAMKKGVAIKLISDWSAEEITVFHPLNWKAKGRHRVNEESIVFALRYGEHRFLFTGDIEEQAEEHLENEIGKINVIKVAHHGSRTSSSPILIKELDPDFSVISCGQENRFGHPHQETLHTLKESKILRTDLLGTIIFHTDGQTLRWQAQ